MTRAVLLALVLGFASFGSSEAKAFSLFGLCLFACVDANVDTADLAKTGEHISDAATQLSEGLKGLDPLALKTLMNENEALRTTVTSLRGQLSALPYHDPVVVLKDQELRFVVKRNSGEFTVKVWIDGRANSPVIHRIVEDREPPKLNVATNEFIRDACLTRLGDFYSDGFGPVRMMTLDYLRNESSAKKRRGCTRAPFASRAGTLRLLKRSQEEFDAYLAQLRLGNPDGSVADIDLTLNPMLFTLGEHAISIEITPNKANSDGTWTLRGELELVVSNENRRVITSIDFDHRLANGHTLGTPLPLVEAAIVVSASP